MLLYTCTYIALGQGQTTPWRQNSDVNRKALSLCYKFKKIFFLSLILYIFFHVFIHVYSLRTGPDNPLGTKFWYQYKPFVTLLSVSFINIFPEGMYVFPYKSIRKQIWPCCKKGQSQPKVIIWTNFVGTKSPVLHTKPQGHWFWFWFDFCFTALRHILGHFGRGQLT